MTRSKRFELSCRHTFILLINSRVRRFLTSPKFGCHFYLQLQASEDKCKKLSQEIQCNRHNMESVKTLLEQKVRSLIVWLVKKYLGAYLCELSSMCVNLSSLRCVRDS